MTTPLPSFTPRQAALAFLTPTKAPLDPLPSADGERLAFELEGIELVAHAWGAGPLIVLVHGWEGSRNDLLPFAPPLVTAGYRVLAIDLPAHGESTGRRTSIPAAARVLLSLQQQLGAPWHAVLAHSVGTAVAVEAMALGLQVGRIALISAPAHYLDYARHAARAMGLGEEDFEQMLATLEQLGVDVPAISTPRRAAGFRQPALFVHSADDRVVPIRDGRAGAQAWPGARFLEVDGLGHKRLLRAPAVIAAVADFLNASDADTTRPAQATRRIA